MAIGMGLLRVRVGMASGMAGLRVGMGYGDCWMGMASCEGYVEWGGVMAH